MNESGADELMLQRLKQANERLLALRWLLEDFATPGMPSYVCFNVTPACNLSCPHCPSHGTLERKKASNAPSQRMAPETLSALARQTLPYARTFNLTLSGETLVIPGLEQLLELLLPYGARLEVTTNGTRLTPATIARLLPIAETVQVSCDGASAHVFEQLRKGARHREVLRNIKLLTLTAAKVSDLYRPRLGLSCAAMGSNLRELPMLVRLAQFLGIAELRVAPIIVLLPDQEDEAVEQHRAAYNYYTRTAYALAQELGIQLHVFRRPFPDAGEDPRVSALPRMIIKNPLSDEDYDRLPPFQDLFDVAEVERESSLLAESIRARGASRPMAAPVWTAREVQRVEADFDRLARANRRRLRELAANATQERPYCVYLQSRMFTRPDAALLLCCNSPPAELPSLQRTASRDAWNGRQRRALIEQFLSDAPPAFCANCAERSFRPLSLLLDTAFPAGLESYLAAPAIRTGWWDRWFRASRSM